MKGDTGILTNEPISMAPTEAGMGKQFHCKVHGCWKMARVAAVS